MAIQFTTAFPKLAAINAVGWAADKVIYLTGSGSASATALTSAGRDLIGAVNAADARTALGLGTIATQAASSVAITGGTVAGLTSLSQTLSTPASASAPGTAGQIKWDGSYIYVCTGTDTWKRVAIATW